MLMPSIFGENLFDDWMDFSFPDIDKALYGKHAKNEMKTDVRETEDGYLTVTATAKKAEENTSDKKEKYVQKERFHATCNRSFYVGDNMKQEDIKAKFENGVLTLQVPKKEEIPEEQTKKFITIG